MSNKIIRNSFAGLLRVFVTIPALFFITPFTINKIGLDLYGLWSFGAVILSYASISDMGFGVALIKYIAEYNIENNLIAINKIINTTLATFVSSGFIVCILVRILINPLIILFNVPEELYYDARITLLGFSFIFFLNLLFGTFLSILDGLQKMVITNIVKTLSFLIQSILLVIFLNLGFGLIGMLISSITATSITGFLSFFLTKRYLPSLKINTKFISKDVFKETFKFGAQIQVSSLLSLGFDPFVRILISNLTSLSFVSVYDIAYKISSQIRSLALVITNPLMPASSEIAGKSNDLSKVKDLHIRAIKLFMMWGIYFYIFAIVIFPHFVPLWLGNNYSNVVKTFQIINIGWLSSVLVTPAYVLFRGCGQPKYTMYATTILVSTNVLLGLVFGGLFGYYGIIWAISLSLLISSIYLLIDFSHISGGKLLDIPWIIGMKSAFISITISFCCVEIYKMIGLNNYFSLGIVALFSFGGYIAILILFRLIDVNLVFTFLSRSKIRKNTN